MIPDTAVSDASLRFSVVIPTYNRKTLVLRAIESVQRQRRQDVETIVVDDAAPESAEEVVRSAFPSVRYVRRSSNGGPGPARDDGIRTARAPWVLMLDDDDELVDGALDVLEQTLDEWFPAACYPFLQFTCTNGGLDERFRIVRLEDYIHCRLWGDFTHIVERREYLRQGLHFPATRLGAESLLVWDVAERFGIPTWNIPLTKVHHDAPARLTHFTHQVRRACEYAQVQEQILERFGGQLRRANPRYYTKKLLGAATYHLLAGKRADARRHLVIARRHAAVAATALAAAGFLPRPWFRQLFLGYRCFAQLIQSQRIGPKSQAPRDVSRVPRRQLPSTNDRANRRVLVSLNER